jgi:hypothetical protein
LGPSPISRQKHCPASHNICARNRQFLSYSSCLGLAQTPLQQQFPNQRSCLNLIAIEISDFNPSQFLNECNFLYSQGGGGTKDLRPTFQMGAFGRLFGHEVLHIRAAVLFLGKPGNIWGRIRTVFISSWLVIRVHNLLFSRCHSTRSILFSLFVRQGLTM